MSDNITLPRELGERIRESMQLWVDLLEHDYDIDALTALAAALAEPDAKPEPATYEQAQAAHQADCYMEGIYRWHDYRVGWQAAERFHGIRGSK
jgi:hypothetical protein